MSESISLPPISQLTAGVPRLNTSIHKSPYNHRQDTFLPPSFYSFPSSSSSSIVNCPPFTSRSSVNHSASTTTSSSIYSIITPTNAVREHQSYFHPYNQQNLATATPIFHTTNFSAHNTHSHSSPPHSPKIHLPLPQASFPPRPAIVAPIPQVEQKKTKDFDVLERKAAFSLLLINNNSSDSDEQEPTASHPTSPKKRPQADSNSPRSSDSDDAIKKNKRSRFNDELWLKHYAELKKFKAQYGHCNVTQSCKDYKILANWVHNQRKNQGRSLPPHRREKLLKIGFEFDRSYAAVAQSGKKKRTEDSAGEETTDVDYAQTSN